MRKEFWLIQRETEEMEAVRTVEISIDSTTEETRMVKEISVTTMLDQAVTITTMVMVTIITTGAQTMGSITAEDAGAIEDTVEDRIITETEMETRILDTRKTRAPPRKNNSRGRRH